MIVGLENSFGHYHGAGVKLGLNLLQLRQSDRVVFYDGLKNLPKLFEEDLEDEELVKTIFSDIKKSVRDNTLIIVDQVSILTSLGVGAKYVYLLCHYLSLLINSFNNSQLVIRMFDSSDGQSQLVNLVSSLSSCHVSVRGLETGESRDVSGVLLISTPDTDTKILQFKILDKDVKVFAPGTSSAVL